jgi:hypothetical protein
MIISLTVCVIGIIFTIQHYPHGKLLSIIGVSGYMVSSTLEISRLRKIIINSKIDDVKID